MPNTPVIRNSIPHYKDFEHKNPAAAKEGPAGFSCYAENSDLKVHVHDILFHEAGAGCQLQVLHVLRQAAAAGVNVLAVECAVTPESMELTKPVPVKL